MHESHTQNTQNISGHVCDWCNNSKGGVVLPTTFCWTKMQTESGQTLESIFRRKEMERAIGNGIFYWGVGNALGASVDELVRRAGRPEVLFSVMRSKPKHVDVSPSSILIWTQYVDRQGRLQPLPKHVLVLSRGDTEGGRKKRCYALVCHSDSVLAPSKLATLDISHFKNIGASNGKVGFSQVTANIEHKSKAEQGSRYEVSMRAMLVPPYFIALAGPKKVTDKDRKEINEVVLASPTQLQWKSFVETIRTRQDYEFYANEGLQLSHE